VGADERGQSRLVGFEHRVTLLAQLFDGVVEVDGVPQHHAVQDQPSAESWSSMPS
jgi:hypothetical protein